MEDNIKIEKWNLEDGRRAERRVVDQKDADGQGERIIEVHVEDERPLRLQQRVIEKTKPVLYERKFETIDIKTGQVIEQKIESLERNVPMQIVDHIAVNNVSSQGKNDSDKHVTKQEMIDAIVAAIKTNRECSAAAHSARKNDVKKVQSLGLAEEIEKISIPQKDGSSLMDKILFVVIAAQVVGLGYILFFM
jgi:hypothetical protein